MVDRFGAQAIFGRTLTPGEMRRMVYCERFAGWYQDKFREGGDWTQWAKDHPEADKQLNWAIRCANGE